MKRLVASVVVAAAVAFAIPTSAAAEAHAYDCAKAAAAWKKKNPNATKAQKKAESIVIGGKGSCNVKTKDL